MENDENDLSDELKEYIVPYEEIFDDTIPGFIKEVQEIEICGLDIWYHISQLNPKLLLKRDELFIAIRLTECMRLFSWIKICLIFGSYQTIFRELRFMIDSMVQAYYIDINHFKASFESKLEVFKALSEYRNFIGSQLIDRTKLGNKEKLKKLYKELSDFVHPSYNECIDMIRTSNNQVNLSELTLNVFNKKLLLKCIAKSKDVCNEIIEINRQFQNEFLKRI